jgi:hypothetical protein
MTRSAAPEAARGVRVAQPVDNTNVEHTTTAMLRVRTFSPIEVERDRAQRSPVRRCSLGLAIAQYRLKQCVFCYRQLIGNQ